MCLELLWPSGGNVREDHPLFLLVLPLRLFVLILWNWTAPLPPLLLHLIVYFYDVCEFIYAWRFYFVLFKQCQKTKLIFKIVFDKRRPV